MIKNQSIVKFSVVIVELGLDMHVGDLREE